MKTIYVVDDNDTVRELVEMVLEPKYHVVGFSNGHEAYKAINTVTCDLIITDYEMPVMNGVELADLVKESSPDTPIMLCSGNLYAAPTNRSGLYNGSFDAA